MKIIVLSDTHGDVFAIKDIVEKHLDCELFLHAGDGAYELKEIQMLYPHKRFVGVKGNSDFGISSRLFEVVGVLDKKIVITHGHHCGVAHGLEGLIDLAKENNADIAIYGHLHRSQATYQDGIHIMNPGSPESPRGCAPSYGIIDITTQGIVMNIVAI